MNTITTHRENVERGAALLDERRPDWADEIDIEQLSMAITLHCVLGQLYDGDYIAGMHDLFGIRYTEEQSLEHGFDLDYVEGQSPFERSNAWFELQQEWIAAIEERRDANG